MLENSCSSRNTTGFIFFKDLCVLVFWTKVLVSLNIGWANKVGALVSLDLTVQHGIVHRANKHGALVIVGSCRGTQ